MPAIERGLVVYDWLSLDVKVSAKVLPRMSDCTTVLVTPEGYLNCCAAPPHSEATPPGSVKKVMPSPDSPAAMSVTFCTW